jgi:hypothetical protein
MLTRGTATKVDARKHPNTKNGKPVARVVSIRIARLWA